MIDYQQSSGKIGLGGRYLGTAYSGHGAGFDNPKFETVPEVGPIPAGKWKIVRWFEHHPDLGPVVAELAPVGHNAHGRTGFFIHGDNVKLDHSASLGCIVAIRAIRQALRTSGVTDLEVTA